MRIALGADHRGIEARLHLQELLRRLGHDVSVFSVGDGKACDYPDVAYLVARAVVEGRVESGILVCGTGIGVSIAANKVPGIRAAVVHDEVGADLAKRHNNANVLCLSGDMLGMRIIERIVQVWLRTEFEGGRHARRVAKITAIEQGKDPATCGVNSGGMQPAA